jgi:hypothetical protein
MIGESGDIEYEGKQYCCVRMGMAQEEYHLFDVQPDYGFRVRWSSEKETDTFITIGDEYKTFFGIDFCPFCGKKLD